MNIDKFSGKCEPAASSTRRKGNMVRTRGIAAIIAASAAAVIILVLVFLPILAFASVDIQGLRDSYRVNEEIAFSATISGFARLCAETRVSVVGVSDPDFHYGFYLETPVCGGDMRFFFQYDIPRDGRTFTFNLDQPGTYKVVVTYEGLFGDVSSLGEKEFTVTE